MRMLYQLLLPNFLINAYAAYYVYYSQLLNNV